MKKMLKSIIVSFLAWQVRRLLKKNKPTIIGVVGSIGKTSTKNAIATVLSSRYRVRYQSGNYNDIVTVPLIFFDESLPSLFNPYAWLKLLLRNEKALLRPCSYDVIVLELGTDCPGTLIKFKKYLHLDYGVITAVNYEHVEFFKSLDAILEEETSLQHFTDEIFYNKDLCPESMNSKLSSKAYSYGTKDAEYSINDVTAGRWSISHKDKEIISIDYPAVGLAQVYSLSCAAILGAKLGLTREEIQKGASQVVAVPGRMQLLRGKENSTIIDDTYNANPDAAIQSLATLKDFDAPHKIALLGNMNELGEMSPILHSKVGDHCKPEFIDLLVTLGSDANEYLAEAAEKQGCKVVRTASPYEAGRVILENLRPNSVVLAKGSQNGVFAEEALKSILRDKHDETKLVRQEEEWLAKKRKQFGEAV